jgi:hypothetical protein
MYQVQTNKPSSSTEFSELLRLTFEDSTLVGVGLMEYSWDLLKIELAVAAL